MAQQASKEETTLRITRTFTATREKVFRAWTDPDELKQWFAPSDDYATPLAEVDLRVGGRYRIEMKAPDGESYIVGGEYWKIDPPAKLVFTWAWEEGHSCDKEGLQTENEMLVTLEFIQRGQATELILTQEDFRDAAQRDKHEEGWTGCLDRLAKIL